MNKFLVFPCSVKENKEGATCNVVTLLCASSTGFAIFFPVSEENSKIINSVLEKPIGKLGKLETGLANIISVYKTMVDSWNSGGRFLSGIYMDTEIDANDKSEIICVRAIISNTHGGYVDNVISMNFAQAIIIAALYRFEIVISKELLSKLMPDMEEDTEEKIVSNSVNEEKRDKKFPKDKQILKIAKRIMNGKIK
jgi:hypothetical protein